MPLASEAASPLDGLASAASVVLIMEIGIIILLCAVLTILLAILVNWLHEHVVPPTKHYSPAIRQYMAQTDRKAGQVIDAVAEIHARRASAEAVLRYILNLIFPLEENDLDENMADTQPLGE